MQIKRRKTRECAFTNAQRADVLQVLNVMWTLYKLDAAGGHASPIIAEIYWDDIYDKSGSGIHAYDRDIIGLTVRVTALEN